jgi:hypothetical protein
VKGDAISDLFLKYSDVIITTYRLKADEMKHLKYTSKTLAKTHEKHLKTIVKHM